MRNRSLLSETAVVEKYRAGTSIQDIQTASGISRAGVYGVLARCGIEANRREILKLECKFCGEKFDRPRSHAKGENGGYCSQQCFHAARSLNGEYSIGGGSLSKIRYDLGISNEALGRRARKVIEGLLPGQVVHHIDGDRTNNAPDNLRVFDSNSEHMIFHHQQRVDINKKPVKAPKFAKKQKGRP